MRVICSCSEVYYQEQGWHKHLVNTKQAKEAPECSQEEVVGEVNGGGFMSPRTTTVPCHQPGSSLARNHWGAQGAVMPRKPLPKWAGMWRGSRSSERCMSRLGLGFLAVVHLFTVVQGRRVGTAPGVRRVEETPHCVL